MSGIRLCLYDDPADLPRFLPFTQSRPIGELRYGAHLLRERAGSLFGPVAAHLGAPHLARFAEPGAPPVLSAAPGGGPLVLLRSTFVMDPAQDFAVALEEATRPAARKGGVRLTDAAGATVGAIMVSGDALQGPAGIGPGWPAVALRGKRLDGVWEIVADLTGVLRADIETERAGREGGRIPAGCTVLGDPAQLLVDDGALVEPLVVFDLRSGPVWIRAGAEIRATTRLTGPLVVGQDTRVVGGQLRESSIGPQCVVHGEVSNCVFLGYANKSHDGFLGHSIVGRWANLGAGTITSNLKNTYGPVRLNLGAERVDTGMTFLGSLIGDHVKTAIGTMLPTGCVIGTGANLFGTRRPEALVAAFAWGTDEPGRHLACRMFLQTASRILPRRDVAFDAAMREYLESVWCHATGLPCD